MAKLVYKTKDEVPETLREHAKETADKSGFEVTVAPASKLNEFRDNNVALSKERDDLRALTATVTASLPKKSDGSDYTKDEVAALLTTLVQTESQVKDGTLKASKDIENTLNERTKTMQDKHTRELAEANVSIVKFQKQATDLVAENHRLQIVNALSHVIADESLGLRMSALPDIQDRAARVMRVDPKDGVVIVDANGTIMRGEDGVKPMTAKEWIGSLRESAEHFFKASTGGGAQNSTEFYGHSRDEFNKMSPEARLHLANEDAARARNKRR